MTRSRGRTTLALLAVEDTASNRMTPELAEANRLALNTGFNAGDIQELFQGRYEVAPCTSMPKGSRG